MSDFSATTANVGVPDVSREQRDISNRQRWFEVALVLLVAFGGSILNALYLLQLGPNAASRMSNASWAIGIFQEVTGLLLLSYVLSRRRLGFKALGLHWSIRDVGVGILVTGVSFAVYTLGAMVVQLFHYTIFGSMVNGPSGRDFFGHPAPAAFLFCLINPFFEELIVRAYLMTEILDLTGSATIAIGLSVAVQTSYHLYYGWAGAISMAFGFLVLAIYFARSRRALPIVTAHAAFDIYGFMRLF